MAFLSNLKIGSKIAILPILAILGLLINSSVNTLLRNQVSEMNSIIQKTQESAIYLTHQLHLESNYLSNPKESTHSQTEKKRLLFQQFINDSQADSTIKKNSNLLKKIKETHEKHNIIFTKASKIVLKILDHQNELSILFHESDKLAGEKVDGISIMITHLMIEGKTISPVKKELRNSLREYVGLTSNAMLNTNELLFFSNSIEYKNAERTLERQLFLVSRACKSLSLVTEDSNDKEMWSKIEKKQVRVKELREHIFNHWKIRETLYIDLTSSHREIQTTLQLLIESANNETARLLIVHKRINIIVFAFIFIALTISGFFLVRNITHPIRHLEQAINYYKQGNHDIVLSEKTNDEIGNLTKVFNEMILHRLQADEILKQSEAKFRKMIEKSPLPMMITDQNQDILSFNDKFTESFGYTLDDISTAEKWWDTAYPDEKYRTKVQNSWMVAIEEAAANNSDIAMQEWDLTIKDRTKKSCEFYMVPLGDISLIVMNDITNRIKTEKQLQQAQKMEAIGTLAGGIAHDFNNILFPLIGFTEMLQEDIPQNSPLQKSVTEILKAALRAKELVKQILTFSRQGDQELKPVKLQIVIKEALKLLGSSIPTTIDIQSKIDPDCGMVVADPTQIHQIVMNLATNAFHAMQESGGQLKVSLTQTQIESKPMGFSDLIPGKYALLKVIDTGAGIKKNVMDKIFDPYFTTKPKDKGTGLGLSVVKGIAKSYNGDIHVYSEPDKGTEIHVYLPIIKKISDNQTTIPLPPIQGGTERILLVDDEESILIIERHMLERLGYHVIFRTDSSKALEAFKENPDDFDLIITDMTMPDMTGDRLAKEILSIKPDIPIIVCTGFSERINKKSAETIGVKGFLMKPVIKSDMAQMVRKVLNDMRTTA